MNDCYLSADISSYPGSLVAARIPQRMLETGLGFLFILVAMLTIGQVSQ
jgi:putative Ca2+/H+ antiporter (TMEM165/GDT1 family)